VHWIETDALTTACGGGSSKSLNGKHKSGGDPENEAIARKKRLDFFALVLNFNVLCAAAQISHDFATLIRPETARNLWLSKKSC